MDLREDLGRSGEAEWVVSVVVPTLNSATTLAACLESVVIQKLLHGEVELIVVDGGSTDDSVRIAEGFAHQVHHYVPEEGSRSFTAPHQRNLGASLARGKFVYYVDADMVLPEGLLAECVSTCETHGLGAVIIFEKSFGTTFWAQVKRVERDCYRGNDLVEAPRFVRMDAWRELGGLDTGIGGGGDDWDLHIRLRERGVRVGRVQTSVLHNEGALTLQRLARKRFLYAKDLPRFMGRHGVGATVRHYSPFSRGYVRAIVKQRVEPKLAVGLVVMRVVEYGAGALGVVYGLLQRRNND